MLGQYISVKQIIEELYADNGYTYNPVYEDLIRWSVDALNLIGHPLQYRRRVTGPGDNPDLEIKDFKAKLPCNLHRIEQISVNGFAARYSGDSFHHLLSGECCTGENTTSGISNVGPVSGAISTGFYIDGFGNEFDAGRFSSLPCVDITYDINADCLTLSQKEGSVCIAYLEFPVDEEGLPLIPDMVSYKEAVKKYLSMKLDYIEWRKQPASQGKRLLYDDSKQEWAWYVGKAANKAKLHSVDQLESIKNQMLRTYQSYNHHKAGFKNLGQQQRRRIK